MSSSSISSGRIWPIVLKLALPTMFAQFINVLYSIVDRIYIAKMPVVGDFALAGVGIVAPICTLITSFSYLIGLGGAPLMAMSLGENNNDNAKKILSNSFLALLILGIIIPLIILFSYEPLLYFFGASDNTFQFAKDYLLIYLIGAPFALMSLGLNQFIISQGYSTKGMLTMLIGAIVNIILDPIFIFSLNMGVKGAALATTISQIISFIYVFIILISKYSNVKIGFKGYSLKIIGRVSRLGFSPFLIGMTDSLISIVLNISIKLYSKENIDTYITVATLTNTFFQIFSMPLLGISSGTGSILSFNFGARNITRVKKSEFTILKLALIFTTMATILSFVISKPFLKIFTDDIIITNETLKMIRIFMSGFIILSFQYCFVDGLTALGKAKYAVTLSLIRKISMILLTLLLPLLLGINGCFYAELISDISASIITLIVFLSVFNKILNTRKNSKENVI